MFFVTDFEEQPKGVFSKIKLRVRGENPTIEYHNIGSIIFGVIKGIPKGNRHFFRKVKSIVGNDVLIFQNGFDIFEKNKRNISIYHSPTFKLPSTTEYYQRLLVNFAIEVSQIASKNSRVKVLLIDIGGNCSGVCIEFMKVAQEVVVLTNNFNRYDACIRYSNQTFGATPKIVGMNDKINDISFIIAPYGLCGYIPQNTKTPIFSLKNPDNGYGIFEDGIVVDKEVKNVCPRGISPTVFSSQFFLEKGHITDDKAVFLRSENKCFTVEEMVKIIQKD